MKTLNDFFEKVYVITCLNFTDRHQYVIDHFKDKNISFEFKSSLDKNLFQDGPISKSMKSLLYGHLNCIIDSKLNNYSSVLICEDDVAFCDNYLEIFNSFTKKINNDWKFLQLGNQFFAEKWLNRTKIEDGLYRFLWGTGSHCIGIHKSVYDVCINEISKCDDVIDFIYYRMFSYNLTYCPERFLADGMSVRSDMDYEKYNKEKFKFDSSIKHGYSN